MNKNPTHGLHRINEVLDVILPELLNKANNGQMEYFKIREIPSDLVLEINRAHSGDFVFTIKHEEEPGIKMDIFLSPTEALDLAEFINKRLAETSPHEPKPF